MYPNIAETLPKLTGILPISQTAHEDRLVEASMNVAIKSSHSGKTVQWAQAFTAQA